MKFDLKHLALLIGILYLGVVSITQCSKKVSYKRAYELAEKKYQSCINAPVRIDTVHDTIVIREGKPYKPVPANKPVEYGKVEEVKDISKSVVSTEECENWYDDVYSQERARIHWRAYVKGCQIEEIEFKEIVCPKEIITKTFTVDTCITKAPAYKPKNHLGMSFGFSGNTIDKFPNIEADLWWSIKDKWGIYGGGEYNMYHKEAYLKAGVKIFFK